MEDARYERPLTEEEKTELINEEKAELILDISDVDESEIPEPLTGKIIDPRFERTESIPLVCKKCGAIFSTKNLEGIGRRSIFPYFGSRQNYALYSLISNDCDEAGHKLSDLRLATDKEIEKLKSDNQKVY